MFTILREILFVVPLIYALVFIFNFGIIGIWLGLCIGRAIASVLNYVFARYEIKRIRAKFKN
jgi:Na+-driven multidrug efflux pump